MAEAEAEVDDAAFSATQQNFTNSFKQRRRQDLSKQQWQNNVLSFPLRCFLLDIPL